jgi:hypothetical protein
MCWYIRAMKRVPAFVAASVAACVASCGSSSRPRDAGDGGLDAAADVGAAPATALEACQQLNEAEAQLHARCLGGPIADWRTTVANSMECSRYARHVTEGLVEYRPEGWAACLAKYSLPCDQADPYPCYFEILHGRVSDGQHCEDTDVCGTVSGCVNVSGAVCGDVCVRAGNASEACGLYCGTSTPCLSIPFCASGLTCVDGTCVQSKQAGEPCGGPQFIACRFGLGCDVDPGDLDGNGTCVSLTAGRACRSDGGCIPTEFCQSGTCTPRRGAGQPCADAPTACSAFNACDSNGVCMAAGHVGQVCAPWPGTQFTGCVSGVCDGLTCLPIPTIGQGCAATPCEVGASCDPNTTTCTACGP